MRIETPRLSIAPVSPDDGIDDVLAIFNSNPDYLESAEGKGAYRRDEVERYIRTELRRENGRCLAIRLRDGGDLVGTAALVVPHPRGCPWIGLLVIHGDHQGRGLGREASLAIEDALAREGWREVRLGVLRGSDRALRFWTSAGYAVVDEKETTDGLPCHVLAKAIGVSVDA